MYLVNNPILCDPVMIAFAFNVDFIFCASFMFFAQVLCPSFGEILFFPLRLLALPWHLNCAMSDVLCICTCNIRMKHAVKYGVRFGCCVSAEWKKYEIVSNFFLFLILIRIVRSFFESSRMLKTREILMHSM